MAKRGKKVLKSSKRRPSKVSGIKHANKRITKLQRQGKLKKRKRNKPGETNDPRNKTPVAPTDDRDDETCDPSDMMDEEAAKYLPTAVNQYSFWKAKFDQNNRFGGKGKRQREPDSDEDEKVYERLPRKEARLLNTKDVKAMLPIKKDSKIVPQFMEIENEIESEEDDVPNGFGQGVVDKLAADDSNTTSGRPVSTVELYFKRNKKLAARKEKIALLATKIVENPEENTKSLKELRLLLDDKDRDVYITNRKLVSVSLLEVFKDILPGYRIRARSEKEKEQRMKKETKQLYNYEETLLRHYQAYLQRLEVMLKGLKNSKKPKAGVAAPKQGAVPLGELALLCMCELLVIHPYFNYRNNIINLVVPFMDHFKPEVSDRVCESVVKVYKEDKIGDVSLEIVKSTVKLIREKNSNVQPKVLNTFLALKIKDISPEKNTKKKFMTKKEKMMKLSRQQRKRSKHMEQLERELHEAELEDGKQHKSKVHTEIISQIFTTYFRILKKDGAINSAVLPSVLEGLSKFAHLINVEFFDDLIVVLHKLMESDNLKYRESLHCLLTVFTILDGQGNLLNIDPLRFYTYLYKNLFKLHAGNSSEDVPTLLNCLDLMFTKRRKQVTLRRLLAFLKRLSSLGLQVPHDGTIAFLMTARNMMVFNKQTDLLLDTDASQQGSGMYLPELDEPEHCNPNATALYELHTLTKHYHPVVRKMASHLLHSCPLQGEGQLTQELVRKSPSELWNMFSLMKMEFEPPLQNPSEKPLKKSKVGNYVLDFRSAQLTDLVEMYI